jgi:outer membrane protein assembly factor BamB
MRTILTSLLVGSLLTTLALAQQPSRDFGRRGLANNLERRTAQTTTPATPNLMAYVINIAFEFGAVDLRSGAFLPIGSAVPSDVGDGLVQGPGTSLLSLGFDGKLVAIDPFTGLTSVVGATGLGDCSTPTSPCGPNSANWIGLFNGQYYVTDFANNLYFLNPKTAATTLIGPTGIPALTFVPFSENPEFPGSVNVFAEGLFGYRGKFYAYFSTQAVNFATGTLTNLIAGEIYQIDPATGHVIAIAPADSNFSAIGTVHDEVYAFDASTGQVDIVDPTTGDATPVTTLDPSAGVIAGVAPALPKAPAVH